MKIYQRALGAAATTALISSGLALGAAESASAEPAPAPARQAPIIPGFPELPGLPGLPSPSQLPELSLADIPGVGQLLNLTKPIFANLPILESLLTYDVTWLCDGQDIGLPPQVNPWQFIPTEAQAGCQIGARVVATALGFLPLQLPDILGIQLPGAEAPKATKAVAIAPATAKVGSQLTSTAPTWDTEGLTTTYQWLRAGTAIAGATGTTYTVTPEDAQKAITLRATGTKGEQVGTSTSNTVTPALGDAPTAAPPTVSGVGKVGSTLQAGTVTWSGTGPITTTYQWYRGATAIAGATASQYVLTAADAGQKVAVMATGTRTGYTPGRATSLPVDVAGQQVKVASTTAIKLAKKSVAKGTKAKITVTLRATGGATGTVKIKDKGKLIKTIKLSAANKGKRTVKLPKLAPGVHKLKAVYTGSATANRSKSTVVKLTVRKKR